ncbi:MAG: Fic family protein [Gammaproteobacteria bacterium]
MNWNWQQADWPHFRWEKAVLEALEAQFLQQSGIFIGATQHFSEENKALLTVDMITGEAVKTSEIEGEYLNRESVQASICRNFGLKSDHQHASPAERGIADMMTDLYRNFSQPLSHDTLYHWHTSLTGGRHDLKDIGHYRTHAEPMQIISGPMGKTKIHFEAPPSALMKKEMDQFITWFAQTAPHARKALPALTRAGIAHLYFVSIHPFEDGNGRIARAIAEKSLSECLGTPTLIALSQTLQKQRKAYYQALERNSYELNITDWLVYFANTILHAQQYSLNLVEFLIEKTKLYDRVKELLNERQKKVIARLFREGLEGFTGGLSAENYISITGTSRATATRDLQNLLENKVLIKHGQLKSTRYYLNILHPVQR